MQDFRLYMSNMSTIFSDLLGFKSIFNTELFKMCIIIENVLAKCDSSMRHNTVYPLPSLYVQWDAADTGCVQRHNLYL